MRQVTKSDTFKEILEWYELRKKEEATILRLAEFYLQNLEESEVPTLYEKRFNGYVFPCKNLDQATVGWIDFWIRTDGGYHLVNYRRNLKG